MDALHSAKEIVLELRSLGHVAYFAGGWVRDFLLGIPSSDIDIATDAEPDEIVQIFPDHVLVGAQFGVVLVLYGPHQFEIATFRKDVLYENGRKPTHVLLKSTPYEDAQRRDFTINGMFYDPATEEIHDFVHGKEDLAKKIIRTIGNPLDRFQEDRLRMVRACRFACRFGFTIEEQTEQAIQQLSHTLLPAVSMERIWQELSKMHESPHFAEALYTMHRLGLLSIIFPPLASVSQEGMHERLAPLSILQPHVPCILLLTQLFHKEDISFIQTLQQYLRASNEDGKWIECYIEIQTTDLASLDPYHLVKIFANKHFEICFEVHVASMRQEEREKWLDWYRREASKLDFFIHAMRKKEPIVRAKDLISRGIQPGVAMGKLLEEALKISINQNLRDKNVILSQLL